MDVFETLGDCLDPKKAQKDLKPIEKLMDDSINKLEKVKKQLSDSRKIIIYKNKPYSTLKLFCEIHGVKYNTYNRKSFPIKFEGNFIYKEPLINSFEKTTAGEPKK